MHSIKNGKKHSYGICLGASTITAVNIVSDTTHPEAITINKVISTPHHGNPKQGFHDIMSQLDIDDTSLLLVTGRKFRELINLKSITEPEAVEYALEYVSNKEKKKFTTLVSAGGETFMVYLLGKDNKICGISTGNKCASGTGEFFLQQIRRMNLDIDTAVELGMEGDPYTLSGRCTVFCKSDCTHALNKGESIANVTAGLCRMIAGKLSESLQKTPGQKILLVGGTSKNHAVVKYLKHEFNDIHIPEEATCFEALGAALAALAKGSPKNNTYFKPEQSRFSYLEPLLTYQSLVTFNTMKRGDVRSGDKCFIGLDVGSTTTKAVLLREQDDAILGSVYLRTNGDPVKASGECYKALLDQLAGIPVLIEGIGVTGSGRQIAGLYSGTEGIINEIIAHATAALYFSNDVDTIFEIGGQDAKYTAITNSVPSDYAMNQACSAGTGSFLEESALETLGVRVEDIAEGALQGQKPPNFNDQCSAFISSDIKNAIHEGVSGNDILAGLVYSICFNYINRVKGNRPVGKKIFVQGGVCYNKAVPYAMAGILKRHVIVPPDPGLMGAFGVALELKNRINHNIMQRKKFSLPEIISHKVVYENPFVCTGGKEKCDLKCSINRIRIGGNLYPFGGVCSRYYNIRYNTSENSSGKDYILLRNKLMFDREILQKEKTKSQPVIGLNQSFITLRLYPLYHGFFSALGCRLILSDTMAEKVSAHLETSMCYPAHISIGLFKSMLANKDEIDYFFIPHVKELYVPGGIKRRDFCSTCNFSRGEGFYLRQIFETVRDKIMSPTISFNGGWEKGLRPFLAVGKMLGFSKEKSKRAFFKGVKAQYDFGNSCKEKAGKLMQELRLHPDEIVIVLFGRPYNAYSSKANKGVPQKFTSRGYTVIPYDMIDYENEPIDKEYADFMTWEAGQRILRVARMVKRDPQLFGVFITNFLCGPDSFILPYFRGIMGTKPSLALELDEHTADAGINTRIEAFLDIIANYRKIVRHPHQFPDGNTNNFRLARIQFEHHGVVYVDSKGEQFKPVHPEVKMLVPQMGVLSSEAFAAVVRRQGIRAEAFPPSDSETLHLGRNITTGKECLPLILIIGALAKYLKYRDKKDENDKLMLFVPKASGHCRLGQYHVYINQYLKENKIENVALLDLGMEERFAGFSTTFNFNAWKALNISDVLEDIKSALYVCAQDRETGMRIFDEEVKAIYQALEHASAKEIYKQLYKTAYRLKEIPLRIPFKRVAKIALTGEIFVRRDSFSNLYIAERLTKAGFAVTTSPVAEILYYANFLIEQKVKEPRFTLTGWLESFLSIKTQRFVEKKIKNILSLSGLYKPEMIDVDDLIKHAEYFFPSDCDGEHGLSIGLTIRDVLTEYCAIVHAGPFGCMQTRFADVNFLPHGNVEMKKNIFKTLGKELVLPGFNGTERIPYLSIESDGNPSPQLLEARYESFCLEAQRAAEKLGMILGNEAPGF
ncbi:MAG: hypothetical protein JXJ04_21055 [Spirochaetales bacterium]|nr:hypothetical protein [Spirochaetales bacterium]